MNEKKTLDAGERSAPPAGSVSFFWPLSKDHEPDRPATLAYQCCAGLRPTYSKCIHRYENGSWLASASIDPVFTAEDLILIAADMLTRTPNNGFTGGSTASGETYREASGSGAGSCSGASKDLKGEL